MFSHLCSANLTILLLNSLVDWFLTHPLTPIVRQHLCGTFVFSEATVLVLFAFLYGMYIYMWIYTKFWADDRLAVWALNCCSLVLSFQPVLNMASAFLGLGVHTVTKQTYFFLLNTLQAFLKQSALCKINNSKNNPKVRVRSKCLAQQHYLWPQGL